MGKLFLVSGVVFRDSPRAITEHHTTDQGERRRREKSKAKLCQILTQIIRSRGESGLLHLKQMRKKSDIFDLFRSQTFISLCVNFILASFQIIF